MTGAGKSADPARGSVEIYTDGACSGNPGPGGWGVVLTYGGRTKELCGGEAAPTTNNRMELMAAIQALESLRDFFHLDKCLGLGILDARLCQFYGQCLAEHDNAGFGGAVM